jgi:hypothetical protein
MYINDVFVSTATENSFSSEVRLYLEIKAGNFNIDNFFYGKTYVLNQETQETNKSLIVSYSPISLSSLSTYYLSSTPQTIFDIGDFFDIMSSISYDGDYISDANCTYIQNNSNVESYPRKTNLSLSICNTACDNNVDNPYSNNYSVFDLNNLVNHSIIINGCYNNLPQEVDVFVCNNKFTIPKGSFPLCEDGFGDFFIESDACLNYNDIEINVSAIITENNNRFILEEIVFSSLYGIHKDYMGLTVFYNTTLNKYYIDHPHTYYDSAQKEVVISCSIYPYSELFTNSINLTYNEIYPEIYFDFLNNSLGLYNLLNNISIFEYSASSWDLIYSIVDNNLKNMTILLKNTSTILNQQSGNSNFVFKSDGFLVADFESNPFFFNITTYDKKGKMKSKEFQFSVTDVNLPICSNFGNVNVINNTIYHWNSHCVDENFFNINVTCDNGYSFYEDAINQQSYVFNGTTNIEKTTTCNIRYCDGHTKNKLSKDFKGFVNNDLKEIKIKTIKNGKQKEQKFKMMSNQNMEITTIKRKDRLNFEFKNKNKNNGKKETYIFKYFASEKAVYIPDDTYHAWIVDSESETWFDANLKDDENAEIEVTPIDYGVWEIKIKSDKQILKFESIGELNCKTETQILTAIVDATNNEDISTYSLVEIIFLGILIGIICFMVAISLYMRVPALIMIVGLIFMALGIFVQMQEFPFWLNISGIGMIPFGLIMMIVAISYTRK